MSTIDPPNTLTPLTPAGLGTPATLTPVTEATTNPNNALIGYDNLLLDAASIGSTDVKKMLIPNTYERHQIPSGASFVDFFMNASRINYVALGAHNLGTHDGGVPIIISFFIIGGGEFVVYSSTPVDNGAIMVMIPDELQSDSTIAVRISFSTSTSGASLGVVYSGVALEMQRSIYGGHSPSDLSQKTSYQSTMSESGQFLGRTVTRRGSQTSFAWKHLEPIWYRDNFQPFVQSSVTKPFFIQWKPSLYPLATSYGFTTGDIKPSNMGGGNDLMSVSFNFKGHSD